MAQAQGKVIHYLPDKVYIFPALPRAQALFVRDRGGPQGLFVIVS